MQEHLTLVMDPLLSADRALEDAVNGVRLALGLEVRAVFADTPLSSLGRNEADLTIIDAAAATDQPRRDLVIAASLRRHPVRDRALSLQGALRPTHSNPFGISSGARVGVTSLRHVGPLLSCCDAHISVISGECADPQGAIASGVFDALVLSGPQFHRITFDGERFSEVALRFDVMPPAPGNAAFVLAAGAKSPHLTALACLNDPSTERCVWAELELLRLLGPEGPALGCFARETADGAIRLAACLTRTHADCNTMRASRVASVAPDPREAALTCFAAFQEIEPAQDDILLP